MLWFDRKAGGIAVLFGMSVVLSGCSDADAGAFRASPIQSVQSETEQTESKTPSSRETGGGQEDSRNTNTSHSINTYVSGESVSLSSLPEAVFQTDDGKLLLLGDNVILMNAATLETEICREVTELNFSFQNMSSWEFAESEDEYLVMGNYLQMEKKEEGNFSFSSSSEEPQLMLIRFSKDLERLETLNIGEAMGANRGMSKFDFICNGTKLLCSSMEGFFLYDLETGIHTKYPMEEALLNIYAFGYMESTDRILFAAFYNDGTRPDSQCVLGSMRMDGTDLEYEKKQTQEWGEIKCFENFALIEDGKWNGNGERASVFYYGADKKVQQWPLADEYATIQASETGKYFAVQSRDWDEGGNSTGYTVRVYTSDGGRLIQEISYSFSEIEQNTMLCECIVSENMEVVFLLLCDRETKSDVRFQIMKF